MKTKTQNIIDSILDNNDNYTKLIVDIGRKSPRIIPKYIQPFLIELGEETRGAFKLLDITMVDDRDPDHIKLSIVFTLTVEAKSQKYQEYSDTLIYDNILPFITGCGFDLMSIDYVSYIPNKLQNIATSGELDVMIITNELYPYIQQILLEVFGEDMSTFEKLQDYSQKFGGFKMEKKLSEENLEAFEGLMNKLGIRYAVLH